MLDFKRRNLAQGFTLIEIIIAMAIVAIAVLAIANAMNQHTNVASELEKRIIASWVAANVAAQVRHDALTERVRAGTNSDTIKMGGHQWRASSKITKTDVDNVYLLKINIKDQQASAKKSKNYASLVTAITGS